MPGVPKSQGCQSCKLRKIKCDETWPACSHCETSRLICPGPTQLFKFVHNNFQDAGKKRLRASSPKENEAAVSWHNLRLQTAQYPNTNTEGTVQSHPKKAASPRAMPQTASELSSVRLVSHIEGGLQSITHLGLTFVMELPKRISGSGCLRDSVELFCSALTDFQHPHPKRDLMQLPQYGKALRSLRLALTNKNALKAETLAAVALMERASNLFDRQGRKVNIHSRAVIQMMKQKGPTKTDDELDVAVCNDIYGMTMVGWTIKGDGNCTKSTAWKEAIENVASTHEKILKGGFLTMSDLQALVDCCRNLNVLIKGFQSIFRRQSEAGAQIDTTPECEQLRDMESIISKTITSLVEKSLEQGTMTEKPDLNSITGKKYDFRTPTLCQLYLILLFLQLVPLHIRYESDIICHGKPDHLLHANLRAVAVEVWMCMPYIQSLDQMAGFFPEAPLYATYEVANAREREYILDMVQHLDEHSGRLPATRDAQRDYILKNMKILMGRDSESFYF